MKIRGIFGNVPNNNLKITSQNPIKDNNSVLFSFNDDDGIIDANDISFLNNKSKEIAAPYIKFLEKYYGEKWTDLKSDTVKSLIEIINSSYKNYNDNYQCVVTDDEINLTDDNGKLILSINKDSDKMYINSYSTNIELEISKNYDGTYTVLKGKHNDYNYTTNTYRTDESLYETVNNNNIKETYDRAGNLISCSYPYNNPDEPDRRFIVRESYQNNELRLREIYKIKSNMFKKTEELVSRVAYEEGKEITVAKYEDNELKSFVDYRIKDNNEFFDKNKLNGSFDVPIQQGLSGICYMVGIVNSMYFSKNVENREDLDIAVSYDNVNDVETVTFKGLDKSYEIPMADIEQHMTRFGLNDPDFSAIALAYEKHLCPKDEEGQQTEKTNTESNSASNDYLDDFFAMFNQIPAKRTIDGGNPADFYFALTGKKMTADFLNDESFEKAKASLKQGGIVNAGTPPYDANNSDKFISDHDYSVLAIDEENNIVTLYEPNRQEYRYPTIEEFKQEFRTIYYN